MRLRDALGEAWRGLVSGASRPVLTLLLVFAPMTALAVLDVQAVSSLVDDAVAFRHAGAGIWVLNAADAVSGPGCDDLASVAGVVASGAVRTQDSTISPDSTPQVKIPLFEATPGFGRVLGGDLDQGVLVEDDIADAYGLGAARRWPTDAGALSVAAPYPFPDDGRNPELQYGVVGLGSGGNYDECWVATWPYDDQPDRYLYAALSPDKLDATNVTVVQLNPRYGTSLDAVHRFHQRLTRFAPWIALGWGILLTMGIARLRRLELAFSRHLGIDRVAGAVVLSAESGLLAAAATPAMLGVLWLLSVGNGWSLHAFWFGGDVILAASFGTLVGSVVATVITTEASLFRFYKTRT